jgi:hypothetical protein
VSALTSKPENLAPLVQTIRGEKVLLAADLAALYGVSTKALNQAVKRNSDRFPANFMFQLTAQEWNALRSQTVTSKSSEPGTRSQTVTYDARKAQPKRRIGFS